MMTVASQYLEGKVEVNWTEDEQIVSKQFVQFQSIINNNSEVRRTR